MNLIHLAFHTVYLSEAEKNLSLQMFRFIRKYLSSPSIKFLFSNIFLIKCCDIFFKDEPKLVVINECHFEIRLLHPTCSPKCTTRVYDHLVDLRPLMNVYRVTDGIGNFSMGICESNPECESANSIGCLMTENETIPLSGDLDILQYYEDDSVLKIRGKYKGQRKSRKHSLFVSLQ